jgi:flagellar hook-length control protein FliK
MATAIAKKIAALLQQQGTDTAKAAQAAATPAVTGGQGLATLQNILQLQGEQPQNTPAHHTAQSAAQADDAPLPAPQAQQPAAEAKTDGRSLPQIPAVTGQNTQNGGMQNGFGQNGFGQNGFGSSSFSFFASADGSMTTTDTGGMQSVTQNFAQYNAQATAQTLPAQTTQMIALQIQRNAATRVDSFTLQLDPADLGRLDVELKFHRDGSIQAHLSAERPETLAMLQKDSAHLERILQQAGFDTKDGALSFDLRQQSDGNNADGTGKKRAGAGGIDHTNGIDNNEAAQNAAAETRQTGYIGLRGVNIMV